VNIHIGTSGWSYDHWTSVLYPPGTPSGGRLRLYSGQFDTVELNSSFCRWPREAAFAKWREHVPAGFQFSVEAPRGLTHAKKLLAPEQWVGRIATCWHELGSRRGALLVQLPPATGRDDDRLQYFLAQLPGWLRVVVEFRHSSWLDDAVFGIP